MKGYTTAGVFFYAAFFVMNRGKEEQEMVRINGKDEAAAGVPLNEYLAQNQYPADGIAVECNEEIVPKSQYADYVLKDGDVVEIVSFVGGG